MHGLTEILVVAGSLGSGLVAGIFFAFSSFVMRALAQLPKEQGIAAMQAINRTVINPGFLGLFFGTGVACLVSAAMVAGSTIGSAEIFVFVGAAFYCVGCVLVTIARNVPLNNQLASTTADAPSSAALWDEYLMRWTRWNHVRTLASLLSAVCLALSLASD